MAESVNSVFLGFFRRTSESTDSRIEAKEQPGISREQKTAMAAIRYDDLLN